MYVSLVSAVSAEMNKQTNCKPISCVCLRMSSKAVSKDRQILCPSFLLSSCRCLDSLEGLKLCERKENRGSQESRKMGALRRACFF